MHFAYPILYVKDIEVSKFFYHDIFEQDIEEDFGEFVSFRSGFALWEQNAALDIAGSSEIALIEGRGGMQLEFQTANLEAEYDKLKAAQVRVFREIHTLPWQQKYFYCLDPDNHIIMIVEHIALVARRMFLEGHSVEEIMRITNRPQTGIETMLG